MLASFESMKMRVGKKPAKDNMKLARYINIQKEDYRIHVRLS